MTKHSFKILLVPAVAAGAAALTLAAVSPRLANSAIPAGSDPVVSPVYSTLLAGSNEVPAGDPDGTGTATVILDKTNNRVCYRVEVAAVGLPSSGAHIHAAAAGVNGPIVVDFTNPDSTGISEGCATPRTGTTATDIGNNPAGFYVNIHSSEFPAGAIRGQLATPLSSSGEPKLLPQPLRAYDSREATAGRFGAETRTISLRTGKDGTGVVRIAVPPGATGAILNLTLTATTAPAGWAKIYSAAASEPATSAINWTGANVDIANSAIVAVDTLGRIKVTTLTGTHVIIDVVGFTF